MSAPYEAPVPMVEGKCLGVIDNENVYYVEGNNPAQATPVYTTATAVPYSPASEATVLARATFAEPAFPTASSGAGGCNNGVVTAAVFKNSLSTKVGIKMTTRISGVYITQINSAGLLQNTALRPGMRLISINDTPVTDADHCALLFRQSVGVLTIAAEDLLGSSSQGPSAHTRGTRTTGPVAAVTARAVPTTGNVDVNEEGTITATVYKNSFDAKVGLKMRNVGGAVYISEINPHGLLASTVLQPGLRVISVNNIRARNAAQVAALCKDGMGPLTFVAQEEAPQYHYAAPSQPKVVRAVVVRKTVEDAPATREMIHVSVFKPSRDTKVGLVLSNHNAGYVTISQINPSGLLAETSLRTGLRLVSVNGVNINDAAHGASLCSEAYGALALVAQDDPRGDNRSAHNIKNKQGATTTAAVFKETRNSKVGIKMRNCGRSVYITSIAPDGLLANTYLEPGQQVVSVNSIPIDDSQQAASLIRTTLGSLHIVATLSNVTIKLSSTAQESKRLTL